MQLRFAPAAVACVTISAALAGSAHAEQTIVGRRFLNPVLSRTADIATATAQVPAKPFSKLFQPRTQPPPQSPWKPDPAPSASPTPTAPPTPRVACGMTLIPVDPAFDARIRKEAPTRPKPASRSTPVTCQK